MVILPCEIIIGSETFVDMETRFVQMSEYAAAGAFVWLEVIKRKSTAAVFKRIYVDKRGFVIWKVYRAQVWETIIVSETFTYLIM